MRIYALGSRALAHEAHRLRCGPIRWLGDATIRTLLNQSESGSTAHSLAPMGARERTKVMNILQASKQPYEDGIGELDWARSAQQMLWLNVKSEIEAVDHLPSMLREAIQSTQGW